MASYKSIEYLLVDGYNMIGAWPQLRKLADHSLEEARLELISRLADYQGYSGLKVIVVFDAHRVSGEGKLYRESRVDVRYTRENETADECIERLVTEMMDRRTRIYVATSDMIEQHVIFGKGALRISARELLIDITTSRGEMEQTLIEKTAKVRNTFSSKIPLDMRKKLEKWRRGE